jgi:translocation and assembly module TamB
MPRALRWLIRIVAALIVLPLVLIAAALVWLNTAAAHRTVAALVSQLTAGQVVARDLTGNLLRAPAFGRIELRDPQGVWAVAHGFVVDWSPLALLHRDVKLDEVRAGRLDVLRRPVPEPAKAGGGTSSWYGFRVDIDRLAVARITLAPAVAGLPAALAANGEAHLTAATAGRGMLAITRLDAPGSYTVEGDIAPARMVAQLSLQEPAHGLIAGAAALPDLGALAVNASIAGPTAAVATKLTLQAGALRAAAGGTLDLDHGALDLDLTASAPAMAPRPDLSWQSVGVDAHAHGPFERPEARGTIRVADLAAFGAKVERLAADVAGDAGRVGLHATAEGIRVPGPNPELLAAAPLRLDAEMAPNVPSRPLTLTLVHPLIAANGKIDSTPLSGKLTLELPDLAPLAAAAGIEMRGHSKLEIGVAMAGSATRADVDGTVAITGGLPQAVALIGPSGRIRVGAALNGDTIVLSRFQLQGKAVALSAEGQRAGEALRLDWKAELRDLRAAVPTLIGQVNAHGRVHGTPTDLAMEATGSGEVGAPGVPRGPVKFDVALRGLPAAPAGHVTAEGALDRAPLALAVDLNRAPDGAIHATIDRADWKSAHAEGALTMPPGATMPEGRIALRMARLADLRPFLGAPVGGALDATASFARDRAELQAVLRGGELSGAQIASATLRANVGDPTTRPVVDVTLNADGLRSGTLAGRVKAELHGPEERLDAKLGAKLENLAGAPAAISAAALIDAKARTLTLAALQATWKGLPVRLLAPARIAFGATTAVENLRLGAGQAVLQANGRIAPSLELRVAASNLTPDLAQAFLPTLKARGTASVEARLTGTLARPAGTARLTASGLQLRTGPGQALPPANLTADATLDGTAARIDAHVAAGSSTQLTLAGSAPLAAAGPLNLRATGGVDLAVLDPLTEAQGVRVRGHIALDAGVAGTLAAPAASGTLQLTGGDVQDFAQGAHLSEIQATLEGAGNTLRVSRFSARAGDGTIAASGSVGVLAPAMPVALTVTMTNAKPLSSNLLTATLDANVALSGQALGQLRTAGTIRVLRADINVPEHMPASVAVLPVRVAGQPPPPPPAPGPDIALDLDLSAARGIYVRGRGLNVELGGRLHVGGTAAAPHPSGAFHMIRGQFSLAGTTLDFSDGSITFAGRSNVGGGARIDPALHFVATSQSAAVTATLTVGGFASDPKITLASVPQLPQDEILARLLFGQGTKNLSPFQIAAIGSAIAQFSGAPGGVGDPLNRLRSTLGLDRLTIGTNPVNPAVTPGTQPNNTETTVQAGRYVAPGVYVGAQQGIAGGQQTTSATVQIDVTKHVKLQTGVGSGLGANNVGLTYQFQY